jgi:hypothetical protein
VVDDCQGAGRLRHPRGGSFVLYDIRLAFESHHAALHVKGKLIGRDFGFREFRPQGLGDFGIAYGVGLPSARFRRVRRDRFFCILDRGNSRRCLA